MHTQSLIPTSLSQATFIWRSGRAIKNAFIVRSHFPTGYYACGAWSSQCHRVTDTTNHALKYCEDVAFWDFYDTKGTLHDRRVVLSCDPGRKAWNTVMGPLRDPEPRGDLWVYSPSHGRKSEGTLQRLTLAGFPVGHDFHPLGLEVYPSHAGNSSTLFVANHARTRTVIEQFTLTPTASGPTHATWVRTLTSSFFVSPNSIALTSQTSFYVSNDHLITRRIPSPLSHVLPLTETLLGLPLSWLSHVSIEEDPVDPHAPPKIHHTFVALGVAFANGVAVSPDGKQVALAGTSMSEVYFYARSPEDNTLTHTHTVPVPFSPDNISFDDNGSLIVTGHPVRLFVILTLNP
jgi:hypothetical protein